MINDKEVLILGGGPAGLSCGLWLVNQGYQPIIFEQTEVLGGQLNHNHHENDWLLGFYGATGSSIKASFQAHIDTKNITILTGISISQIAQVDSVFSVDYAYQGQQYQKKFSHLVLACGTRARATKQLFELSQQHPQKVLIGAGSLHLEQENPAAKVAILGGGDNAFENAWQLAQHGLNVDVICRSKPCARQQWVERCKDNAQIQIHWRSLIGYCEVKNDTVYFELNGETKQVDKLLVMFGYQPNTDMLVGIAPWINQALNQNDFIEVNKYQQTNISNLYAIGDITDHPFQSLPLAIGQGSVAAKTIVAIAEGLI